MGLLSDMEAAATDSTVPIADLLRKCKVLAARLKHQELADWATKELNGYGEDEQLPPYRCFHLPTAIGHFAGPFGRALKNVPIPDMSIPAKFRDALTNARMADPIAAIEDLSEGETLSRPWSGEAIAMMQRQVVYEGMTLLQAHAPVSAAMMKGIVDAVRTRVLDYVLAIQAANPDADTATPAGVAPIPQTVLHQTFNATIIGGQANIGGHGPQAITGANKAKVGDPATLALLDQLRQAAATLTDHERKDANAVIKGVENELAKEHPNLDTVKSYLDVASKIAALAPFAHQLYGLIRPMLP